MHVVAAFVVAFVLALAAANPAAAASRYMVAPHDTLFSIARRFRVPLPVLAQVNRIHDPSRIRTGDVLLIPDVTAGKVAAPAAPAQAAVRQVLFVIPAATGESYIVRAGDTLYHLAKIHGTTVEALQTANGLASPAIIVGQVIRFPRPVARPSRSAAPGEMSPPDLDVPEPPSPNDPAASPPDGTSRRNAPASPLDGTSRRNAPASPAAPAKVGLAARVRASALAYLDAPYVWGGSSPSGVDCSGLVYLVYAPYVAHLPRTSYDQWAAGTAVERADLLPGDLVFFNTDGNGASHVGIYVGDGQFVHAAASAQRVIVDRLDAPYYLMHYVGARRIL